MPFHTEIPKRDREKTQKQLASNDTNLLFVAHCELLSEGFDHPLFSISVVLHSVVSVVSITQKVSNKIHTTHIHTTYIHTTHIHTTHIHTYTQIQTHTYTHTHTHYTHTHTLNTYKQLTYFCIIL